jgi:hypothetical protein
MNSSSSPTPLPTTASLLPLLYNFLLIHSFPQGFSQLLNVNDLLSQTPLFQFQGIRNPFHFKWFPTTYIVYLLGTSILSMLNPLE